MSVIIVQWRPAGDTHSKVTFHITISTLKLDILYSHCCSTFRDEKKAWKGGKHEKGNEAQKKMCGSFMFLLPPYDGLLAFKVYHCKYILHANETCLADHKIYNAIKYKVYKLLFLDGSVTFLACYVCNDKNGFQWPKKRRKKKDCKRKLLS